MKGNYVLRRYDKSPTQPWLFSAYTEQVTAIPFEINGVLATTLFVRDKFTRDRALKLGWKDETDAYKKQVELQEVEKLKKEAVVETFSSTQNETKAKRRTRKK